MGVIAEYPFHKGAKGALYTAAVLLVLLVFTIPIAIYFFWRIGRAKVTFTETGLEVNDMGSSKFEWNDVARLGLLKIPLAAKGAGGALAQAKLGGLNYGLNVVVQTKNGKNIKFVANQYERHEEMVEKIKQHLSHLPCEEIPMGIFGWKWPQQQKAA